MNSRLSKPIEWNIVSAITISLLYALSDTFDDTANGSKTN